MPKITYVKAMISFLLLLSLVACANRSTVNDNGLLEFNYHPGKSYVLSKCYWYDNNHLLLAFEIPQEKEHLKLISFDLENNTDQILFEGPASVEYTDQILINNEYIGYQNEGKALIFDRNSLALAKEYNKATEAGFISYSPNMEYLAEVYEDGLYVTNNKLSDKRKIEDQSGSYVSLAWANDNSKLVYITNDYRDICIINNDSMAKQTLVGNKDFEYPDGFVDLMWCGFLPNNSDIIVNMLGEENNTIAIIDSTGANKAKYISEDGNITIMGISDHIILYTLDENHTPDHKLISFDYINNNRNILYNSASSITSACFSPDKKFIFFGTFYKGENHLFKMPSTNVINGATVDQQSTQNENEPYFNQYLQRYEIVDGYSDGFLEIMDEKITFNGNGYQEISTPFLERIMFNAVRFYIAAATEDFDTLRKMAGQELSSEIEKALGDSGNYPYKYGGDVVASFKNMSQYPKPISITAPIQTEKNKYNVTLEYSNKENRRFIDVILDKQSNEIKIISFSNKP